MHLHRHRIDVSMRHVPHLRHMTREPHLMAIGIALVAVAALAAMALIVALVAVASVAAFVVGGSWLLWKTGTLLAGGRRSRRRGRQLANEVRGLIEIAATPDPMERYLLAVREYERLSAAALDVLPEEAGTRRQQRRTYVLAEQAENLAEAVEEIERALMNTRDADGARTHVWELALASRDVANYLSEAASVRRGAPSLATLRALTARRAALAARRSALVERLDAAEISVAGRRRELPV